MKHNITKFKKNGKYTEQNEPGYHRGPLTDPYEHLYNADETTVVRSRR